MMKIGLVGTGLMGQPMVVKLLQAELEVIAYNRTQTKLQPLKELGAEIAATPKELFAQADVIILMLTDYSAIAEMLTTEAKSPSLQAKTIIQMGTIAPEESQAICHQITKSGGSYLEAPVLGSIPQVKTGELIVMVGSTQEQFGQWQSLLQNFSPQPIHTGEVGTASAMKLALNQLIAGLTSAFALSLGFAQKQGVDLEQFMTVLRESALYAPTFDKKLTRMEERNFANPNFPTKHLLKDTKLFLDQAEKLGLATASLAGIQDLLEKAIALGLADEDYSAIYNAINPTEA